MRESSRFLPPPAAMEKCARSCGRPSDYCTHLFCWNGKCDTHPSEEHPALARAAGWCSIRDFPWMRVCVFPPRNQNLLRKLRLQYFLYIATVGCALCVCARAPFQSRSSAMQRITVRPAEEASVPVRSRRSQGAAASVNRSPSEPEPERAEARESRSPSARQKQHGRNIMQTKTRSFLA